MLELLNNLELADPHRSFVPDYPTPQKQSAHAPAIDYALRGWWLLLVTTLGYSIVRGKAVELRTPERCLRNLTSRHKCTRTLISGVRERSALQKLELYISFGDLPSA